MDVKMNFDAVMLTLSATLGLSVVVERVLEFLKNILEPRIGSRVSWALPPAHSDTTGNQKRLADTEKMALAIEDAPETLDRELSEIRARLDTERSAGERKKLKDRLVTLETIQEWEERFPPGTVLVEPATDADDGTTLRVFVLHLIGFALGILLARIANVQVFHAFLGNAGEMRPWVDTVFTGLLIGGGSAPVHVLIRFISERKVPATAAALDAQEQRVVPAAVVRPSTPDIDGWVDIAYEGGVDRDKLEQTHHRPGDPDTIVYHHTAMNSRSTFEDVVRVIKNRTDSRGNHWLTGYHCVVLADGSIHPFCRWDRYGSHARGYNLRSLGLAFNGNYETDPRVPYSNPTGAYGPPRPTDAQVRAGARVVALWSFLYGIDTTAKEKIIPHRDIADKACPGSQFPDDEFKKWIAYYRNRWETSPAIKERIELFKQKPYLYV